MEVQKYKTVGIPKIVHQIWLGPFEPPLSWMASWKEKFCVQYNWQYKLWNEEEIKKFGLRNDSAFHASESYQQKADIARYEICHRYGGFYVDCDMIWLENNL